MVEPVATRHGPSVEEIRRRVLQAGLVEVADRALRGFGGAAKMLSYRRP